MLASKMVFQKKCGFLLTGGAVAAISFNIEITNVEELPMASPSDGDLAVAAQAFVKLLRAASSVSSRVHQHLAEERLTESQFGVLEALLHFGPLSQRDLSEKILKTSGNITMVVDNLQKRGLVQRERAEADRRVVMVQLTPEGHGIIQRAYPRQIEAICRELSPLSNKEQRELGDLCKKIGLGRAGKRRTSS